MSTTAAPLALITGTTHGIGRVCARELARAGYTLIMLCRDLPAATLLRDELASSSPQATVHVVHCDLAVLDSVRAAAATVRERFGPITRLVNNAGRVCMRHQRSVDGFELTFATNHLGPFLLTALLQGQLAADARIINLASRVHYKGVLRLERLQDPRAPYSALGAYAASKLANVMHTLALARRVEGQALTVNCLHPGVVASNLLPRWLRLLKPLLSPVIFDVERGAATTLYLTLSDAVAGVSGRYFDEHQQIRTPAARALDVAAQEALWAASTRWCGLGTLP